MSLTMLGDPNLFFFYITLHNIASEPGLSLVHLCFVVYVFDVYVGW